MEKKDEFLVVELSSKFDYAFTSLTFAALALSIQYSPNMGTRWPYVLILSWVLLLLSGLIGGWRLSREPHFYKYDLQASKLQKRIIERKRRVTDPGYVAALNAGEVFDAMTREQLDPGEQQEILRNLEESFAQVRAEMEKVSRDLPKYFRLQFFAFVSGILMNGLFNSINFLSKVP